MYKETVSPSPDMLIKVFNQIPERTVGMERRAIRSPYIWLAVTQVVTVCSILFVLAPSLQERYLYRNDPFYDIDKQVEQFEYAVDQEDADQIMIDYTNNNL